MPATVQYHGIDIAIQEPAANLIEMDFLDQSISFGSQKFDLIVVQGVFEYVGRFQSRKLKEIRDLLRDGGRFVVTYTNYAHRQQIHPGRRLMRVLQARLDVTIPVISTFFAVDYIYICSPRTETARPAASGRRRLD